MQSIIALESIRKKRGRKKKLPSIPRNYLHEHHKLTLSLLYDDAHDSTNPVFLSMSITRLKKKLLRFPLISDNDYNLTELELFRLEDKLLSLI